ncbi:hypothetical protein KKP90_05560 [Methanothermococcus sp. SCGC AD-155-E23]|nr:hypothetical protein [Methanothermococcus sp. SCGC AD-155-E23]
MRLSYKDVIILILLFSQILLVFHMVSKSDNSKNNFLNSSLEEIDNSSNLAEMESTDAVEMKPEVNNTKVYNATLPREEKHPVRNISLEDLFLDLPYSRVIRVSEGDGKGIIKVYEKNGRVINFDVRDYKPNLDNPRYLKVLKERRPFRYGIYYSYKYICQYGNNTSVDYCYYREVGRYHIIMGFDREDEFVREMWLRWNEYIESLQPTGRNYEGEN